MYNVGDKVVVVSNVSDHDFKIGHCGVITKLGSHGFFVDNSYYLTAEEVIHFEEKGKSDGGSTNYYQLPEGATELFDLINHRNMNFAVGNIFKACYRMGEKDGINNEYDLRKIVYMAKQELKRIGGKHDDI